MYFISVQNNKNIGSNWPFEMNSLQNQPHTSLKKKKQLKDVEQKLVICLKKKNPTERC